MKLYNIAKLKLTRPLFYVPLAEPRPFEYGKGEEYRSGGEQLFCFELDEAQYSRFEPDTRALLGTLVCGGCAADAFAPAGGGAGKTGKPARTPEHAAETRVELPAGNYLFSQKREILDRDGIIAMAVEIQQEGLWQRLALGNTLYLRYLVEDSSGVTQLFRPYSGSGDDE